MKIFLPFLFFIFYLGVDAQQTKKVLFLGNSYTAANNLPSLISSLATSKGDVLVYDSNTPGGYTFNGHHTNTTSLSKIYSNNWDYVVLQEQSQIPSFPPAQVETDCYPYADSLNKYIQENDSCTRTMFYMTWGRKNGDASNCAFYAPLCTYNGMQARLYQSYLEMANNLDAEVSPVGAVWRNFRINYPSVELYNADESHPSIHGSYLAACTFYASIYHKTPVGASFIPSGITPQEALNIQNTVEAIVFDSLHIWRIDTSTVNANFNAVSTGSFSFQFSPDYLNGDFYFWDFGDGNSTTVANSSSVNHSYSSDGNYTVQLIVSRKCDLDTITNLILVNTTNIENRLKENLELYPNPASDFFKVNLPMEGTVLLLDIFGKVIFSETVLKGEHRFPTQNIPPGNYFIHFKSKNNYRVEKIVILK